MQEEQESPVNNQDQSTDSAPVVAAAESKPAKTSNKKILMTVLLVLIAVAALWFVWVWYALGDDASANVSRLISSGVANFTL